MKIDIWREMQDAAILAAYDMMIESSGFTHRDLEYAKAWYVQTKRKVDRLTYGEGMYHGARVGAMIGASTGFAALAVPFAISGAGIGMGLAHFVD